MREWRFLSHFLLFRFLSLLWLSLIPLQLDEPTIELVMQASRAAQNVLLRRDPNFAASFAFLLLVVGLLLPVSEAQGRSTNDFLIRLLADSEFADYVRSHAQFGVICVAVADYLTVLHNVDELRRVSSLPPLSLPPNFLFRQLIFYLH